MIVKMQDKIIKILAYEGRVSVICAKTTNLVEKARKVHDLSPVTTALLGRILTMGSIMGTEMKSAKEKLTIQIKGNGPAGMAVVTANHLSQVKGYVANPQLDIPLNEDGKLDVAGAMGREGYINVIKDKGLKDPYIGICPLVSGEIAEDFAEYFAKSEQMLEQHIFQAGAISKMLDQNMLLEEIAKKITGDNAIQVIGETIEPTYVCDCSKEFMKNGLATIGTQELQTIIEEDGKAELVCHFCNQKYVFTKEELEKVLTESKRRN